jgi:hypothetical protein
VSIPGTAAAMEPSWALVDTGAENVLAAEWIADFAGVDLSGSGDRIHIGIGGQVAEVTFAEVELRLHVADEASEFISWRELKRTRSAPALASAKTALGAP